jgi:hypothetical protein
MVRMSSNIVEDEDPDEALINDYLESISEDEDEDEDDDEDTPDYDVETYLRSSHPNIPYSDSEGEEDEEESSAKDEGKSPPRQRLRTRSPQKNAADQ